MTRLPILLLWILAPVACGNDAPEPQPTATPSQGDYEVEAPEVVPITMGAIPPGYAPPEPGDEVVIPTIHDYPAISALEWESKWKQHREADRQGATTAEQQRRTRELQSFAVEIPARVDDVVLGRDPEKIIVRMTYIAPEGGSDIWRGPIDISVPSSRESEFRKGDDGWLVTTRMSVMGVLAGPMGRGSGFLVAKDGIDVILRRR